MPSFFNNTAYRKLFIKGAAIIFLSTCFPSLIMAKPTEARLSTLENCHFLGKIEGSSGYGRKFGWLQQAKSSAIGRAEKIGASHVVWERMVSVGVYNGYAVARAYSCS